MNGNVLEVAGFVVASVDCENQLAVLVAADGRKLQLVLKGDCCSQTYWEDESARLLRGLVGRSLTRLEPRESAIPNTEDADGNALEYGCLVVTHDQGTETLDWRNESNGYYSGWVEWFVS